jgi:hypothetical protein
MEFSPEFLMELSPEFLKKFSPEKSNNFEITMLSDKYCFSALLGFLG